jgi:CBS domain containing-hemolysin-like protein
VEFLLRASTASFLAIMFVTYFHVVFGELAPRSVALTHPEKVARILAPPLFVFEWIMRPFTALLNKSAEFVLRLFGQRPMEVEEALHSPEELRILVEQSQEGGMIEKTDATLIEGVFEFSEKNAREVMTPRTDIDALSVDATLDETLSLVEDTRRSRYPVFDETIDNIVGLVLAKDLIPILRAPRPTTADAGEEFDIRAIMRPIHVVPARARSRRCSRTSSGSMSISRSCSTSTAGPRDSSRWKICSRRSSARSSTKRTSRPNPNRGNHPTSCSFPVPPTSRT